MDYLRLSKLTTWFCLKVDLTKTDSEFTVFEKVIEDLFFSGFFLHSYESVRLYNAFLPFPGDSVVSPSLEIVLFYFISRPCFFAGEYIPAIRAPVFLTFNRRPDY